MTWTSFVSVAPDSCAGLSRAVLYGPGFRCGLTVRAVSGRHVGNRVPFGDASSQGGNNLFQAGDNVVVSGDGPQIRTGSSDRGPSRTPRSSPVPSVSRERLRPG
jgi:hypothetical protein